MEPLSIIIGVDEGGGFGKDGKIPWHYPEDLKNFQKITRGGICIMGRRTYEDMLEMRKERDAKKKKSNPIKEILPNRESFVITSSKEKMPGATKFKSLRDAVQSLAANDKREVFIIGGYRLFIEALAWTNKIYMTIVPGHYHCNVSFPLQALKRFRLVDGKKEGELMFITYHK